MECFRWFNYKLDSYPHIEAIETIFLAIILPDVDGRELRAEGHETRSIGRGRQNCVALRSLNEREGKFQTFLTPKQQTLIQNHGLLVMPQILCTFFTLIYPRQMLIHDKKICKTIRTLLSSLVVALKYYQHELLRVDSMQCLGFSTVTFRVALSWLGLHELRSPELLRYRRIGYSKIVR